MASKRKSTTPCMIPIKTLALESGTETEFSEKSGQEQESDPLVTDLANCNDLLTNGHENVNGERFFCKYCNFGSPATSTFVGHMNSTHPDFRGDPSYVCIACSFLVKDPGELEAHNEECHAGDTGLTWSVAKHESYTVVEQSVGDQDHDQEIKDPLAPQCVDEGSDTTITKAPIMKLMKNRPETKKIVTIKDNSNLAANKVEKKIHAASRNGSVPAVKASTNIVSSSIVNGSILGTVLPAGVTQLVSINASQPLLQSKLPTIIAPLLTKSSAMQKTNLLQSTQLPNSKSLPKVMIPLSSIPTYNISMDSNCFLKNSFNKFPYPTKAELCYLTVVTKYPEEQIKIWFTAQRLKQGISWSPEEIEDSRKKMFNTIIQSIPQPIAQPTITVLNAPLVTSANNVQHLLHAALPGQLVGQPQGTGGLLVAQPIIANGIQGAPACVSLTVTSLPSSLTTTQAKIALPASKTVSPAQPATTTMSSSMPPDSLFDFNMSRSKKSRHQLGALKTSFCKNQFPAQPEVTRLTRITGLTTREVRKWFSDKRYHWRNRTVGMENSDQMADSPSDMLSELKEADNDYPLPQASHAPSHTPRRQSWHQTPDFTPTKYKERAPEQIRALESSFFLNNFPSEEEVNRLRSETKMTRREIDGWFSEKRKKIAEENKKLAMEEEDYDDDDEEDEEADKGKNHKDLSASINHNTSVAENSSPASGERKVHPIKINLKDLRVTESNDNTENTNTEDHTTPVDGSSRPPSPIKNKPYAKKTAHQRDLLRQVFVRTQWPTNKEYDELVEQTVLPRGDVVRWFGDSRYSLKNGMLKWFDRYKVMVDTKAVSDNLLKEYYEKHRTVHDGDIKDLSKRTGMTADEVKAWFADVQEKENKVAVEMQSDRPQSAEMLDTEKGTSDGALDVPESSERMESPAEEACSDSTQTVQNPA